MPDSKASGLERADPVLSQRFDDLWREASGREPPLPRPSGRWGGPAANGQLTAWLGISVLVLSLLQLVTLLDVSGLMAWHVTLGALLVPFALAKIGSTGWRMSRYYAGVSPYRAAGRPPALLRLLGPLVIVTTVLLLASGVVLAFLGPVRGRQPLVSAAGFGLAPITLHQAAFVGWAAVVSAHVLARLVPAWQRTLDPRRPRHLPGAAARVGLIGSLVVLGALLALALLPHRSGWQQRGRFGGPHPEVVRPAAAATRAGDSP